MLAGKQRQYVLLLSDKLLYGPSVNNLRVVVPLDNATVYESGQKSLIIEEGGKSTERHKFDAESAQKKESWLEAIRKTIETL